MSKPTRWMAVFDNHGDMKDDGAVAAAFEVAKWFKPEIRAHGGDCFDFRCFRRNASEEERRDGLRTDIDAGIDFLERYKPTHFLRGNHDERLWDLQHSDDNKIRDLGKMVLDEIMEALGDAKMFPYHKRRGVFRLGHLKILHGYHAGINAAKSAALVYGSCLFGHVHYIDQVSIPGLERRVARVAGALCRLDMDYNRAQPQTLRQAHGFAYGLTYPNGNYVAWQAEEVNGLWVFPSEMREFRHAS